MLYNCIIIGIIIRIFLPSTGNIEISRTENYVSGLHICKG